MTRTFAYAIAVALILLAWSGLSAGEVPATPEAWTPGLVNADILRPIIIGTPEVKKFGDYNYVRDIVSQPSLVQEGPLRPITIIVPRNGHGSGQVVMQGSTSQKGLTATMSVLSGSVGSIPASSIRVRYAAAKPPDQMHAINLQSPQRPYYTDLVDTVPDAPVVPIWVTVAAPADTAAGTYKGLLTVKPAGAAKPTEIAVVVEVAPWICPPPRAWTAHMGLVSVPDGTAYYYKVKHFSDQHFALMEKSFALMGEIGCDTLWIPTVEDPMTGSRFSLVRCAKRDGRLVADLSLVEKYLDSYLRHNGPPEVCYLYVQNGHAIGHAYPTDLRPIEKRPPPGPVRVTLADGSGNQQFVYGTPEAEDFFKQVLDGMYAIYAKRGLDTDALMLGTSSEKRTSNAVCTFFKKIGPKWRWVAQEHDTPLELSGVAVGYNCPARTSPISFKGYPWQNPFISGASAQQPTLFGHPAYWRMRCEHWMDLKRTRGISRVGVDMWLVNDGQKSFLPEHWSGGQEVMRICWGMTCMVAPGPDGAIPTTHLEWTREGMQELEARIQIEKAIVAKRLSPEQEAAAGKFLAQRSQAFKAGPHPTPWDWGGFACWNWQDLTRQLFQMAASLPKEKP